MKHYEIVISGKKKSVKVLKNNQKKTKDLTIIIATYNESGNIENLVKAISKNLKKIKEIKNYEIIIVDDDSPDGTSKIINKLTKKYKIVAINRIGMRGLFTAIIAGIKMARGKFILTMDSDFSHPPEKISEMLNYKDSWDIISGSRFVKGGKMEVPFVNKIGAIVINRVSGFILGLKVKDLGGDFHLFSRDAIDKIKFRYPAKFGEFSYELFYRAKKQGMKVLEIPFIYKKREEGVTKMNNHFKTFFVYLRRTIELKLE